jgi:hypothetical protein
MLSTPTKDLQQIRSKRCTTHGAGTGRYDIGWATASCMAGDVAIDWTQAAAEGATARATAAGASGITTAGVAAARDAASEPAVCRHTAVGGGATCSPEAGGVATGGPAAAE